MSNKYRKIAGSVSALKSVISGTGNKWDLILLGVSLFNINFQVIF